MSRSYKEVVTSTPSRRDQERAPARRQPVNQRANKQPNGNATRHTHAARAVILNPLFDRSITGSADNKSRETPSETELEFRKIFRTSLKPPPRDLLLEAKTKEFLYDPTARSIVAAAANVHDPTPAVIGRIPCEGGEAYISPQMMIEGAAMLFLNNMPNGALRSASIQDALDLASDYLAGVAMLYEMYTRTLFAASRAVTELAAAHAAQNDTPLVPLLCEYCGDQLSRVDESHPKTCHVILRRKKEWMEKQRATLRHTSSDLIDDYRLQLCRAHAQWESMCNLYRLKLRVETAKFNTPTPQVPPSSGAHLAETEEEEPQAAQGRRRRSSTTGGQKTPIPKVTGTGGKRQADRGVDDEESPPPSKNVSRTGSITSVSSHAQGSNNSQRPPKN